MITITANSITSNMQKRTMGEEKGSVDPALAFVTGELSRVRARSSREAQKGSKQTLTVFVESVVPRSGCKRLPLLLSKSVSLSLFESWRLLLPFRSFLVALGRRDRMPVRLS
jgi:hypothetical protein